MYLIVLIISPMLLFKSKTLQCDSLRLRISSLILTLHIVSMQLRYITSHSLARLVSTDSLNMKLVLVYAT